ncbi:MAG: hypothetical protein QNJ90_00615 [Planctomycetota bacterium]|nr:hypothetical protein [Planctomycetota bacterium]
MAVCEECGSHQLEIAVLEGVELERCGLCDHLQGNPQAIARLDERREAEELGYSPIVYPLVKALELVPTFHVTAASPGRVETNEFPFVFLRVAQDGLRDVERLLTSLEMANQSTRRRWVVECTLQRGLLFILRPRFWKPILEIDNNDIREARYDFKILADILSRDVKLSWWRS